MISEFSSLSWGPETRPLLRQKGESFWHPLAFPASICFNSQRPKRGFHFGTQFWFKSAQTRSPWDVPKTWFRDEFSNSTLNVCFESDKLLLKPFCRITINDQKVLRSLYTQMKTIVCIQNTHKTVGRKCNLSVLILGVCIREVDANHKHKTWLHWCPSQTLVM